MQEHDDVGILLDRSRFAKVERARPLVFPQLDAAVELAQGDHVERAVPWRELEARVIEEDLAVRARRFLSSASMSCR